MAKFYFFIWLRWVTRVVTCSVVLASIFSAVITFVLYALKGFAPLSEEVFFALENIFYFWFPIVLSFTLLVALFRSLKYIFSKCINGYKFVLFECNLSAEILEVGYGDLVKIWRRWFVLLIWLVVVEVILVSSLFFTFSSDVFQWFSIYWLFGFILVGGYVGFLLLATRFKRIKVRRC